MSSSTEKLTTMAQGLNRLVALFKIAQGEAPPDEPSSGEGHTLPAPDGTLEGQHAPPIS